MLIFRPPHRNDNRQLELITGIAPALKADASPMAPAPWHKGHTGSEHPGDVSDSGRPSGPRRPACESANGFSRGGIASTTRY